MVFAGLAIFAEMLQVAFADSPAFEVVLENGMVIHGRAAVKDFELVVDGKTLAVAPADVKLLRVGWHRRHLGA